MEHLPYITQEDMRAEAELFQAVYTSLIREIDRGESLRGKLNDFQLQQAVAHAKDGMGVLSYERRQTMNAIFENFSAIYRSDGRAAAAVWASQNFGCSLSDAVSADRADMRARIEELALLIQMKETELLQLYREIHGLQQLLAE